MRDKRDRQKKKFIETLEAQGTVLHAAKAAGVSRWTAYRCQREDHDFADQWDEALENAVDVVENSLYQKAVNGDTYILFAHVTSDFGSSGKPLRFIARRRVTGFTVNG